MNNEDTAIKLLGSLIDHLGTEQFPQQFAEGCQQLSSYDSTVIVAFIKDCFPTLLFDNLTESQRKSSLKPYTEGAYLLDPFYQLYLHNSCEQMYLLKDIAPDEFFFSEYYQNYYANTNLSDEAGLWIKINEDAHILVSLGKRHHSIKSNLKLVELQSFATVLIALCRKHWQTVSLKSTVERNPFAMVFDESGFNGLSERERDIVQLILEGHSSKSIARVLEISPETVKVHRKHAHSKLGTSSQAELFSLFIKAISKYTANRFI